MHERPQTRCIFFEVFALEANLSWCTRISEVSFVRSKPNQFGVKECVRFISHPAVSRESRAALCHSTVFESCALHLLNKNPKPEPRLNQPGNREPYIKIDDIIGCIVITQVRGFVYEFTTKTEASPSQSSSTKRRDPVKESIFLNQCSNPSPKACFHSWKIALHYQN